MKRKILRNSEQSQLDDSSDDSSSTGNCTDDDSSEEDFFWDVQHVQVEHATCDYCDEEHPFSSYYFDNEGGIFRHFLTDDYLQIPMGAVPPGETFQVCGRIRTDFDSFANVTSEPHSHFVAPIFEYHIHDNKTFTKHVKILMNLAVSIKQDEQSLKVVCSDGDGLSFDLFDYARSRDNDKYAVFNIKKRRVNIFTVHFSKFTCIIHKENEQGPKVIEAILYMQLAELEYDVTGTADSHSYKTIATIYYLRTLEKLQSILSVRILHNKPNTNN